MEEQKKFPEPVEALVVILLAFGAIIVIGIVITIITTFLGSPISLDSINRIFYIIGGILFFAIPTIYIRFKNYDIISLFRLKPVSSEVIQLSILVGLTIGIVGDEIDRLVQIVIPMPEFMRELLQAMVANSMFDWIILILGTVIIAAFGEELLFRGFLQVTLEKKGDVTRAVILASLSWTLIHANPFWAVQIFIMGVIIGFLAWRTDSVFPGIIVHAINNFLALLFLNLKLETELEWYLIGNHVNPFLLLPSIALLVWCIMRITTIYKSEQF